MNSKNDFLEVFAEKVLFIYYFAHDNRHNWNKFQVGCEKANHCFYKNARFGEIGQLKTELICRYNNEWKNRRHEDGHPDRVALRHSNYQIVDNNDRLVLAKQKLPWYFADGQQYPKPAKLLRKTHKRIAKLLPSEDALNDRITNQLMFVPPNYEEILELGKLKTILVYNGLGQWNIGAGREVFTKAKCPVNTCSVTAEHGMANTADLILYRDMFFPTGVPRPSHQIYMLFYLESPYHTSFVRFPDVFNWTATYR